MAAGYDGFIPLYCRQNTHMGCGGRTGEDGRERGENGGRREKGTETGRRYIEKVDKCRLVDTWKWIAREEEIG